MSKTPTQETHLPPMSELELEARQEIVGVIQALEPWDRVDRWRFAAWLAYTANALYGVGSPRGQIRSGPFGRAAESESR